MARCTQPSISSALLEVQTTTRIVSSRAGGGENAASDSRSRPLSSIAGSLAATVGDQVLFEGRTVAFGIKLLRAAAHEFAHGLQLQ